MFDDQVMHVVSLGKDVMHNRVKEAWQMEW